MIFLNGHFDIVIKAVQISRFRGKKNRVKIKDPRDTREPSVWRREWDSNPRYQNGTLHFECSSL